MVKWVFTVMDQALGTCWASMTYLSVHTGAHFVCLVITQTLAVPCQTHTGGFAVDPTDMTVANVWLSPWANVWESGLTFPPFQSPFF